MLLAKISPSQKQGFTLIELMIALVILAVLTLMAIPSFNTWMVNGRLRASASSIADGLRLARAEAIKRNKRVSFQLCGNGNSIDVGAGVRNSDWAVSLYPATGNGGNVCNETTIASETEGEGVAFDSGGGQTGAHAINSIVIARQPAVDKGGVQVQGWAAGSGVNWSVSFDGMGRIVPHPSVTALPANGFTFEVGTLGNGPVASLPSGIRAFAVLVSNAGQIRVCDRLVEDTADPRYCPPKN